MSRRARLLALLSAALGAAFVVEAAAPQIFSAVRWHRAWVALGALCKLFFQAAGLWAAARCSAYFERGDRARVAWGLVSAGCAVLLAGQLALAPYQILGLPGRRYPSLADACFLFSYPLLIAALIWFMQVYDEAGLPLGTPAQRWRFLGLYALAAALLAWIVILPLTRAQGEPLARLVTIAYPALDLALLAPALALLRVAVRLGGRLLGVWLALLAGFVALGGGDVLSAYISTQGWRRAQPLIDTLFVLGYGMLASGTLAQLDLLHSPPAQPAVARPTARP